MYITYYMKDGSDRKKGSMFKYFEFPAKEVLEKDSFEKCNYLIFNLEGEIKYIYNGSIHRELHTGEIMFLGIQANCMLTLETEAKLLILGFDELYSLCDKFTFQALSPIQSMLKYEFDTLDIRYPMDDFLKLQIEYISNHRFDSYLFDDKLKELFIIFRAYYSKEELFMFFYPIIAKSMDFKNMVLANYRNDMRLEELAEVCLMSKRAFQRHFKEIFGETCEQWILREKSKQVRYYLSVTDCSFKEIIDKLGFDSSVHLNKFCKTWFGMSPTDLKKTLNIQKDCLKN